MTENQFGKGSIDRPEDFLKANAWRNEEIAGAFQPALWKEKNPVGDFATYPKRNQGVQNSCTCYAKAKALSVDELSENGAWRELSPRSIYPYVAVPGGGASSLEVASMAVKIGMTLEYLLPTDGLSESDVSHDAGYKLDAKQIALVYKPGSIVECTADFETIASILQAHQAQGIKKVVEISIIGENNGTWLSAFPKAASLDKSKYWYHRIVVTDFGLVGGRKMLAIDNSWGTGAGYSGQQFLTEDHVPFLYGSLYTMNIPDDWQSVGESVPPPHHQWNTNLSIGSSGADVLVLQQALQSMGMFPVSSIVKPTGAYYGVTRSAVSLFQQAFGIPATGIVDTPTREKLNIIFV